MSDAACAKCGGAFVEGAKRFRDKRGRSFCVECARELSRQKAAKAEPHAERGGTQDGYALADEPKLGGERVGAGPTRDLSECPSCGGAMIRSDIICTKCGFNRATGRQVGVSDAADAAEEARATPERRRLKTVRDDVKRETRNAYIKPAVAIAICLPLAMAIWGGILGSAEAVVFPLVVFSVMFVVTFVVWFVCSLIWIGFDEPMGMETLRLGAVCSMTEIARAALSPLPNYWRVQVAVQAGIFMVFVGSTMVMMEMDKEDAGMFAVLVSAARLVVAFVALQVAVNNGWI